MQGFHFSIKPSHKRQRLYILLRPIMVLPIVILIAIVTGADGILQNYYNAHAIHTTDNSMVEKSQTTVTTSTNVQEEVITSSTQIAEKNTENNLPQWWQTLYQNYMAISIFLFVIFGVTSLLRCFSLVFFMLLFRHKYPKWVWEWNVETTAWHLRIAAYMLLATDTYPDIEKDGDIKLILPNPAKENPSRWLVLIKWLLALPHTIIIMLLAILIFGLVPLMHLWCLITGNCPVFWFQLVEGFLRYRARVDAYFLMMMTDQYPSFCLSGKCDKK